MIASLVVAAPRAAFACPVCFGDTDSPMAAATNSGIMAMLVVVVGVLIAFASFFIYLIRRAILAETQSELRRTEGAHYQKGEGTAQC